MDLQGSENLGVEIGEYLGKKLNFLEMIWVMSFNNIIYSFLVNLMAKG